MFTRHNLRNYILKSILIIVVCSVITGVAISFLASKIKTISASIAKQKQLSVQLERQSEQYALLKSEQTTKVSNIARIRSALLPTNNVLEFVGAIESLSGRYSIEQSLRFDSPLVLETTVGDPPLPMAELNFGIGMQANMYTLVEFLQAFEKLPYFARVNTISFTAQSEKGWKDISPVSIRGLVYGIEVE